MAWVSDNDSMLPIPSLQQKKLPVWKRYWKLAIPTLAIIIGLFFTLFSIIRIPVTNLVLPILGISTNIYADNIWLPQPSAYNYQSDSTAPKITANAAIFLDPDSGLVLYQKNEQQRLSIASLIKIMTVIVTLEQKSMSDVFTVSQRAADFEPDKMYLIAGEKLTVEELLDGVFLVSANDAAEVLAEGLTGNRNDFITLMNRKAQMLGMENTFFINPTGLEEDLYPGSVELREHYSSAFDVALMSRYLITKYPEVVNISSQPEVFIPRTEMHQDYLLYSGINLLTTYPGVKGLKTGYTPEAGLTLVTYAQRDGKKVLGVLLGSTERREDAKAMLDYSFQKLGVN